MNNKEVYINGKLCIINESKNPIQLVYAINDLAELKDRQAYSTNTFKMPGNPTNLAICGFPNDPALIQTEPYRKLPAKIVQDGIEVLPNGIAVITRAGRDIEVQILAGLIGFFDILADKNIRDLDLSDYDHIWNIDTIAASQPNTEGYLYPVIDYGGLLGDTKTIEGKLLRPATFRKTLIERIISEAGYTAVGEYQSYDKYLKSLVAFSNDKFTHGPDYIAELNGYKTSARKTINQALNEAVFDNIIIFQDYATTNPAGLWDGSEFTATANYKLDVTVKYSIDQAWIVIGGSPAGARMRLQKYSGGVWSELAYNTTNNTEHFVSQSFNDQLIQVTLNIQTGEKLRVSNFQQPALNRLAAVVKAGSSIEFNPVAEDVVYGSEVQLAATLPDVSQKNFFKDFLQNFGLIVIPDNYKRELLLINMEEVYANKPNAEDITDKLYDSEDDISFALSGYGINNYGEYKPDAAVTTDLGKGVMTFDNLTLEESKTLFTSIFAASESANRFGGLIVTGIRKIENNLESQEFTVKTEPRILLDVKQNVNFTFTDDEGEVLVNAISLPTFNGLEYQTLFDENYPEILRMLYRPFVVTKKILLKNTDTAAINWKIPVYDKKSASYYYKNQISYRADDDSTISLIRMP